MNIKIREEMKSDYAKIYSLVKDAFEHAEHTDHDEHNLVERLRNSKAFIPALALVAEADGEIVGHILFTEAKVGNATVIALAPVAITPKMQNKGIGSAMIRAGHARAKELGYGFCVLLGHADYYPRFGYVPAHTFGIRPPFEVPDENFMAYHLQGKPEQLDAVIAYAKEFFEK